MSILDDSFLKTCLSCNKLLTSNLEAYYTDLKCIRNDPKNNKLRENILVAQLFNKHNYTRMCCKMRITTLTGYMVDPVELLL